ncbi:PHP domain-containing protein [Candidatus Micrarchaeota archaeon]|nr:PHP domain-containing protein [Candidatus Micrarchaeota archaeon]
MGDKMKADLHSHTHYSKDSITRPRTWARAARRAGMGAIALTDHETTRGWKPAKEECKRQGVLFIPGIELRVREDDRDVMEVLGLFLTEEPRRRGVESLDEVREQDGLVVVPHPFDRRWNRLKDQPLGRFEKLIDGVEGFNARVFKKEYDKQAVSWALKNNKFQTGSGDAHIPREVGMGYTLAPCGNDLEELRRALKKRATRGEGRKSNILLYLPAILANRGVWPWFLDL